jgi:2-polyprenyl-3-methyl-5-hydroxy-6-metoxy-1,4-benzoquinol methylase
MNDQQRKALAQLAHAPWKCTMRKFCNSPDEWLAMSRDIAKDLLLHKSRPLEILDIGSGFGYFAMACRDLGHNVMCIDKPNKYVEKAARILCSQFELYKIAAYIPLPKWGAFDLITTFGVNFHEQSTGMWGDVEYAFLADQLMPMLRDGGRWVLRPNKECFRHSDWALANADVQFHDRKIIVTPCIKSD